MNKHSLFLISLAMVSMFLIVAAYSQEDIQYVDNDYFEDPQREVSVFVHEEHNETAGIEECNECHHVYEDGRKLEYESSEDQRCGDCHYLEASGNQPGLRRAYHLNCKGCHLKQKKGPVMCGQCHVKGMSAE